MLLRDASRSEQCCWLTWLDLCKSLSECKVGDLCVQSKGSKHVGYSVQELFEGKGTGSFFGSSCDRGMPDFWIVGELTKPVSQPVHSYFLVYLYVGHYFYRTFSYLCALQWCVVELLSTRLNIKYTHCSQPLFYRLAITTLAHLDMTEVRTLSRSSSGWIRYKCPRTSELVCHLLPSINHIGLWGDCGSSWSESLGEVASE